MSDGQGESYRPHFRLVSLGAGALLGVLLVVDAAGGYPAQRLFVVLVTVLFLLPFCGAIVAWCDLTRGISRWIRVVLLFGPLIFIYAATFTHQSALSDAIQVALLTSFVALIFRIQPELSGGAS